jgi:hypothetical protein
MKKFIKEYVTTEKYSADDELGRANIKNVVEKYATKYRVDTNINDTIFILETYILESQKYFGSLWNQQKRIDFLIPYSVKKSIGTLNYGRFEFSNRLVFDEEEVNALLKWDKSLFNSLSEKGKRRLPSDNHYATRIIIGDGNIFVERETYLY